MRVRAARERLHAPAFATARVSFGLVVQVGDDPILARDPVPARMIRSAAAILNLVSELEPQMHCVQQIPALPQRLRTPGSNPPSRPGT
jgi:hypothetical protein